MIDVNDAHLTKAVLSIYNDVTVSGNIIDLNDVHPSKAFVA